MFPFFTPPIGAAAPEEPLPDGIALEYWRTPANSGTGDLDFFLAHTGPPDHPFTFSDTDLRVGDRYSYRVRYRDTTQNTVGPWSNIVTLQAAQPYQGVSIIMADSITGAQTLLGIGLETVKGKPVKATHLLDYTGHSLNTDLGRARSAALKNSPAEVTSETVAASLVSGDITSIVKADGGFLRLMETFHGASIPTDLAAVVGPPAIAARTRHRLNHKFDEITATMIAKKGPWAFVYPGAHGNTLSIEANKTATETITATAGMMCLNSLIYPARTTGELTALGLDVAGYSTLDDFGPTEPEFYLMGVAQQNVNRFTYNMDRRLLRKDVFNRYTGPVGFDKAKSTVGATASAYFETLQELALFWGIDPTTIATPLVDAFGPTKFIRSGEVKLSYYTPVNGNGYANEMHIVMPDATLQAVTQNVQGDQQIMQEITITPRYSVSEGVNVYILFVNGETGAQAIIKGTNLATVPVSALFPILA